MGVAVRGRGKQATAGGGRGDERDPRSRKAAVARAEGASGRTLWASRILKPERGGRDKVHHQCHHAHAPTQLVH